MCSSLFNYFTRQIKRKKKQTSIQTNQKPTTELLNSSWDAMKVYKDLSISVDSFEGFSPWFRDKPLLPLPLISFLHCLGQKTMIFYRHHNTELCCGRAPQICQRNLIGIHKNTVCISLFLMDFFMSPIILNYS